jgi:lysophospholipase L1-like esterase
LSGTQPGDVILIQFGINDRGDVPDKEDFKNYLRRYTREARAKQAIPVFVTPTPRFQHKNGVFTNAFVKYCDAKFEVGKEMGVTVIDLQKKGLNFYTEIGPERVSKEMMRDTLHPIKDGAYHLARLLAEGISESNLVPLRDYVISEKLDSNTPQMTDGWNPRSGYTHN